MGLICLASTSAFAAPGPSPRPAPGARAAKPRRPAQTRNGPVELYTVNGKETLMLRLRDDRGRPLRGVQKRFDHLLRCHHTNIQHAMNPRLVRLMYQVGRHYPGSRIEVVSGYRHPSVAKNPRSPHMQGLACDFRISGVRNDALRDYLRRGFDKVGVGYYPNSSFVHFDVRKDRSAFWIDYSGPGERAIYSDNPVADLKSGRVNTYKPTKIDKGWVNQPDQKGEDKGDDDDNKGGDDDGPPIDVSARSDKPAGEDRRAAAGPPVAPVPAAPTANGRIADTVEKDQTNSGAAEGPR